MNTYEHLIDSIGFLVAEIPKDILDELKNNVDTIQSDFNNAIPKNKDLAGQIDKEYATILSQPTIEYIRGLINQYCVENPSYIQNIARLTNSLYNVDPLKVPPLDYNGDAWVNFQSKYEYNPLHVHSGVFSFVIWYQIPFYQADEIKYGAGKGKEVDDNHNGKFLFAYPNLNGEISFKILEIDKTMEGHICIFPAKLNHAVNPFYTSDDYRITISGNITF
jgi:hypothetical protein